MIKKIVKTWKRWYFRKFVHPYLMKHGPECCGHMRDTIVYQMWYGGIRFSQINKWLKVMHEEPIKCYVVKQTPTGKQLQCFYEVPGPEKRKQIVGQLVHVVEEN